MNRRRFFAMAAGVLGALALPVPKVLTGLKPHREVVGTASCSATAGNLILGWTKPIFKGDKLTFFELEELYQGMKVRLDVEWYGEPEPNWMCQAMPKAPQGWVKEVWTLVS
jgi:hypothetical protein